MENLSWRSHCLHFQQLFRQLHVSASIYEIHILLCIKTNDLLLKIPPKLHWNLIFCLPPVLTLDYVFQLQSLFINSRQWMDTMVSYCLSFSFHSHIVERDGFVFIIDLIMIFREVISSFFIVLVQFCIQWWKILPHHPEDSPNCPISLLWVTVAFYQGKTKTEMCFMMTWWDHVSSNSRKTFSFYSLCRTECKPQTINQQVWIIQLLHEWFQNNIIPKHNHFTWACFFL